MDTCIQKRDFQFLKIRSKVGIDGGGGFLKICLNVVKEDKEITARKRRRLLKDGTEGEVFKDTSVRKLFILALVPDIQENHQNVLKLWNHLRLDCLGEYGDMKIASNLKLCNLLIGLQSHACLHPLLLV